tara:strand:- start:2852 stop:3328 length:477 start_codon:yes stop_codon:yes gene_type:complete
MILKIVYLLNKYLFYLIMQTWMPYAFAAAIFIAVRDFISKDIIKNFTYTEYIIIANIIIFIGTIIYLFITKTDIRKIKTPNWSELGIILLRLFIVYIIVDPCIFNSLKLCNNPGYAKSIINLNTLFLLILALIFYKIEFDMKKSFGVVIVLFGTYLIY